MAFRARIWVRVRAGARLRVTLRVGVRVTGSAPVAEHAL